LVGKNGGGRGIVLNLCCLVKQFEGNGSEMKESNIYFTQICLLSHIGGDLLGIEDGF